jgi:putative transposase
MDGAKALRRAILDVFDHPVIARCQQHKIRNVRDKLPERLGGPVEHRMRTAWGYGNPGVACELEVRSSLGFGA